MSHPANSTEYIKHHLVSWQYNMSDGTWTDGGFGPSMWILSWCH